MHFFSPNAKKRKKPWHLLPSQQPVKSNHLQPALKCFRFSSYTSIFSGKSYSDQYYSEIFKKCVFFTEILCLWPKEKRPENTSFSLKIYCIYEDLGDSRSPKLHLHDLWVANALSIRLHCLVHQMNVNLPGIKEIFTLLQRRMLWKLQLTFNSSAKWKQTWCI